MHISEHDLNDLIKLSQLLLTEEGRHDINGIADALLEILYSIKDGPLWKVERMI